MRGLVLTSDTHSAQLLETFSDLLRNNVLTDVTLVCEDRYRVEAHKIVLCAGSSMFRDFFTHNSHPHPMLYLKGVKQIHLLPLVQFLYNGQTEIPQDLVNELLDVAKDLSIKGLEEENKSEPILYTDIPQNTLSTEPKPNETGKKKPSNKTKCKLCHFVGRNQDSLNRHTNIVHPD